MCLRIICNMSKINHRVTLRSNFVQQLQKHWVGWGNIASLKLYLKTPIKNDNRSLTIIREIPVSNPV